MTTYLERWIIMFKNYNFDNNISAGISVRNINSNGEIVEEFTIGNIDHFESNVIYQSRNKLANYLNVSSNYLKLGKQTHSDKIEIVTKDNINQNLECDGLITQDKDIALLVSVADCAAVLIYDPLNQVIAAVHSGWRGTNLGITEKALSIMKQKFGTRESELKVQISAAASGDKYEVGEEVAILFTDSIKQISSKKFLFDNKAEIVRRLVELGVAKDSISIDLDCTISNQLYHSYRRDGVKSGRNATFIKIM